MPDPPPCTDVLPRTTSHGYPDTALIEVWMRVAEQISVRDRLDVNVST